MKNCAYLLLCCIFVSAEDGRWVWDGAEESVERKIGDARYQVHENAEGSSNFEAHRPVGSRPINGAFRPPSFGPFNHGSRPFVSSYRPNLGVLVGPSGPTGIIGRPQGAGQLNVDYEHSDSDNGAFHGRKEPRYREYDVCKCRYSFNCPTGGLKFGACSDGKRYCCFDSKKYPQLTSIDVREGHRANKK